jgi:hypothetical protein
MLARPLLVLIDVRPRIDGLGASLKRDYVVAGHDLGPDASGARGRALRPLESSMPGVFAVGGVRATWVKRIACAIGEVAMAVQYIHDYMRSPAMLPDALPAVGATSGADAVAAPAHVHAR